MNKSIFNRNYVRSIFIDISLKKEKKLIYVIYISESSQKIKPKKQRGNFSLPLAAHIFKKSRLWTYVFPFLLLGIKMVKNVWKTQQPINYIGSVSNCL